MAAASLRAFLVPTMAQIASVHSLIFMLRFGGLGAVNSAKEVGDPPLDFILSLLGTDKLEDKSELSSNESLNKKKSKTYRQKSTNFFDFSFLFVGVFVYVCSRRSRSAWLRTQYAQLAQFKYLLSLIT